MINVDAIEMMDTIVCDLARQVEQDRAAKQAAFYNFMFAHSGSKASTAALKLAAESKHSASMDDFCNAVDAAHMVRNAKC